MMTVGKRHRVAPMSVLHAQFLRIGQLAKKAGVNVQTIRFYEREGLLAPPARTASGYRAYTVSDLERVRVIRTCQRMGFTLKDVKVVLEPHQVLASRDGASNAKAAARDKILASALQRLALIDEKLAVLAQMRTDMRALVHALSGDSAPVCPATIR